MVLQCCAAPSPYASPDHDKKTSVEKTDDSASSSSEEHNHDHSNDAVKVPGHINGTPELSSIHTDEAHSTETSSPAPSHAHVRVKRFVCFYII